MTDTRRDLPPKTDIPILNAEEILKKRKLHSMSLLSLRVLLCEIKKWWIEHRISEFFKEEDNKLRFKYDFNTEFTADGMEVYYGNELLVHILDEEAWTYDYPEWMDVIKKRFGYPLTTLESTEKGSTQESGGRT